MVGPIGNTNFTFKSFEKIQKTSGNLRKSYKQNKSIL